MPKIGEIRTSKQLGFSNRRKFIWLPCEGCKKERWIRIEHGNPTTKNCIYCSNAKKKNKRNYGNWKGGRIITEQGYILRWISSKNKYYPMVKKSNYIYEHRYKMAKKLDRLLLSNEVVHHKDGNRSNNRISNLILTNMSEHQANLHQRERDNLGRFL